MTNLIKKIKENCMYIVVLLFCLTPLVWFIGKDGVLINGIDTNFPLDPIIWFSRRFYVWNALANAGQDFSSSTAGLFFHFIQFVPYKLGFNLQQVQIFSLVFWFSLIILGAFLLARTIFPKKAFVQLLFVSLYSFNIYLFNTWENVKVANLSLVAAVPLALTLLVLLRQKLVTVKMAALLSVFIGIVLSGAGINPAYFVSFFLIILVYIAAEMIGNFDKHFIISRVVHILTLGIPVVLVNLFWILPTAYFISHNISASGSIDKIGFTNWIDSLSQNTSILNIMRLQGAWDWYAIDGKTGLPLYIPYALSYFYRLPFILFSFLLPALAIIALFGSNKRNNSLHISFGVMFVLGVFLGVGTYLPTGDIFRWLSVNLPFFTLFRSPWYIFTPLLTLSLAGLVSLLFYNLEGKFPSSRFIVPGLCVILIVGNLLYAYPLISGKIFRPGRPDSFYVEFPEYVYDAKKWLSESNEGRVIGYPDGEVENFEWGYRGIESILSLLADRENLYVPINTPDSPITHLVNRLYRDLKRGEIGSAQSIAGKLNVGLIFEKSDQLVVSEELPASIKNFSSRTFGKWTFYEFPGSGFTPKIFATSALFLAYPYNIKESVFSALKPTDLVINPNDGIVKQIPDIAMLSGQVVLAENSQLKDFQSFKYTDSHLSNRVLSRDLSRVNFIFELPEDGVYQPFLERYRLEDFGLDSTKSLDIEVDGKKASWNVDSSPGSYLRFVPIMLSKGRHTVSLKLSNKNLIFGGEFNDDETFTRAGEGRGEGLYAIEDNGKEQFLSIVNIDKADITAKFKALSFDPMADYYVEVKYKQIYGNNAKAMLVQSTNSTLLKVQHESMPNYPEWRVFSFYYDPVRVKSEMYVELAAPHISDPLGTKVLYDGLKIQKVFSNELLLVRQGDSSLLSVPKVNFKKLSPSLYEGEVKGVDRAHVIVFSENYSPEWEISAYDNSGSELALNPYHFSANFYANAWYFERTPENYKIKIYYKPQNLFSLGLLISAASILVLTTVSLSLFLIKRRNKAQT